MKIKLKKEHMPIEIELECSNKRCENNTKRPGYSTCLVPGLVSISELGECEAWSETPWTEDEDLGEEE